MKKNNPATDIVTRAQGEYPKYLKSVVNYFGNVPYGQKAVSPGAADKRLLSMSPQDMAQLAAADPNAAAAAQKRLTQLNEKAQPLPGQDTFEP